MPIRRKLVQHVRRVLKTDYNITELSLDMIKGVPDVELEDNYEDYLDLIIDDTIYCIVNKYGILEDLA